jgi:hypothetical protein
MADSVVVLVELDRRGQGDGLEYKLRQVETSLWRREWSEQPGK